MRKLVILRGAMGSGKSTFIKENALELYTLNTDNLRLLFNTPEMTNLYRESVPQFNNKKVWDLLYYLLEERMKKGEFTIVDAVHASTDESFPIYKKLAEKYRYRLYVLDFTNIAKEEVYRRNAMREPYKIVEEYAIDRAYKAFSKEKIPSSFNIVKPEDFWNIVKNTPRNFDCFDKIHIIGDIHGCASSLKEFFMACPVNSKDAYIFVGDYFDRGLENVETFKLLDELIQLENTFFLIGNHEDKLYKYACGDEFKMDYDIKNTIAEFEENGIKKSEIRGFIKKLSQIAYFTFNGKTYLVSHGGIPYIPTKSLDFFSTNSFIYGSSNFEENIDKIYDEFMQKQDTKTYQIHGHRNYHKLAFDEYVYSMNLEGDVEHGGYLRILTLSKNSPLKCTEIKNEVYNPNLTEETKIYELLENMRKNRYIFEKDLEDNVHSFNFSKEAFYNKIWNHMTIQARGLFIDDQKNKIIARSYNKFFNIEEREETNVGHLEKNLSYPVNFYLKYNGFLGLLSIHNGALFFASKSTNVGPAVENFKRIFYEKFTESQIEVIKNKLATDDLTFVFEVIDPKNDPHIIKYDDSTIILLDAIKNRVDFSKLEFEDLSTFAAENSLDVKRKCYKVSNFEEFKKTYQKICEDDFKYEDEYVEGFVIEDARGFMVKIKTQYYNKWKHLRNRMESAVKNSDFSYTGDNYLEKRFMEHLEEKYKNNDIDASSLNIIAERDDFLNK